MSDQYQAANDGIRLFAKGAISAAIVINSGALLGAFSQLDQLREAIQPSELSIAITLWAAGVAIASFAWVAAALAASAFANSMRKTELGFGLLGYACVLIAIGCFLFGFLNISYSIAQT